MAPVVDRLSREYAGEVNTFRCSGPDNPEVLRRLRIQVYPTCVILDPMGREVDREPGTLSEAGLRDTYDRAARLFPPVKEAGE